MGHSSIENEGSVGHGGGGTPAETLISIQDHDRLDYRDAYGVEDTQDAVYVFPGFGNLLHYFEGGYQGGNGRTVHQEFEQVVDRSTSGLNGSYGFYASIARKVAHSDNGSPESSALGTFPGIGAEWCFKIHGHSKAVVAASAGEWGPFSKRYCMARSGGATGVFVASDRNTTANFRVWNFTGATLLNVQLRTSPSPGTIICGPGTFRMAA